MSRRQANQTTSRGPRSSKKAPPEPLSTRIVKEVLGLPRIGRIILVALFALALTLTVTPAVDYVYMSQFFSEQTTMLPALVSTAAGLALYGVGWWLLLGFGEEPTAPRRATLWYLSLGTLLVIAIVIVIIAGSIDASRIR